jgi:hypothetical protein
MSTAIEYAPHNFGHHSMLDSMARPLNGWHQESTLPRNGGYYARDQQHVVSQPPRLPSMASIISTANQQGHGREPYPSKAVYYSDYATPSPVGQTPPQLPMTSNEPHPMSRRPADVRLSPAQSSVASDRSDEYQDMMRLRQGTREYAPEHMRRLYPTQVRQRRETFHQEGPPGALFGKLVPGYAGQKGALPPPPLSQPQSPPTPQPSASPRQEAKSMSISNLLSDGPSASSASRAPIRTPSLQTVESEYRITVRQQPFAARSCGFGERDRRVIDPPPIVQLTVEDPNATPEENNRKLKCSTTVIHCSIWDESGMKDMSSMPEDFRQQRRLMGTLVASPFIGLDENGQEGCFFCFPDLSCRTPGTFRLKFNFVSLDPLKMQRGMKSVIAATAMSEPFQVFNAKDFPGMKASTLLTKKLKEQGCLISIKKGNDKSSASHGRDDSGDDEDEDDGEPKSKGRKRQKKNS